MELLEHQTKTRVLHYETSIASTGASTESLGKPAQKCYYTWLDIFLIGISLLCLLLGLLAVANVPFAAYLGQKNQLILIGLLLSLMAACTRKQVQLFLITFETRFGASTLQNYDSILRYSVLDTNVSFLLKAAIVCVFALPLGLSASYKQFVNGVTALSLHPTQLDFGPVGPPGLADGGMAMMLNATLPMLIANQTAYQSEPLITPPDHEPPAVGSYGFNAQMLTENTTALIDAPLTKELLKLQNMIKEEEVLEFSTYANATICILNSTGSSPERSPEYWETLYRTGFQPPNVATYGTALSFGGATREHDYSFIVLSLWNSSKSETFESEAVGFNIFRGQCNATWQMNHEETTTLKSAGNCTSAPQLSHPCLEDDVPEGFKVSDLDYADALQVPLTCNEAGVSLFAVWPLYDLLWLQPVRPVWVAAVASLAWAELSYFDGPAQWALQTPNDESAWGNTSFPMLKYQAPVRLTKRVQTLHRDRGALYLVLAIQPILVLAAFLGRIVLYSTPVSNGFGLIPLLAGVSRDSLDVLRGATFSGELKRPVRIRISTNDRDNGGPHTRETSIEYELDSQGRHDRIRKRRFYA